ncbi:MAG: YbaB/EbfC family nucleoid-associated protein [Candidatus Andersenbacteria bacterium]
MVSIGKLRKVLELRKEGKKLQKSLGQELVTGSGRKGAVTVKLDGNQKVQGVHIDPELLSAERVSEVEQGVSEAFSDAQKQLQEIMQAKLKAGELKLPDLEGLA